MNFPSLPGMGGGGAAGGGTTAPGFDPNDPNVKWVCLIVSWVGFHVGSWG